MKKAIKGIPRTIKAKSKSRALEASDKLISVTLRNARISPTKLRLVVNAVKGLGLAQAERKLCASKKKGAQIVLKMLHQIKHSARERGMDISRLVLLTGWVHKGITLKRVMPAARGVAAPIRKRFSHISLCCCQG